MQKILHALPPLSIFILLCSTAWAQSTDNAMSYTDLLRNLEKVAQTTLEPSSVLQEEFHTLHLSHGIAKSERMYHEFVRVRLAFEATRDAGLWNVAWRVTNKEPNSDNIWAQWNTLSLPQTANTIKQTPTALAECDELSALFSVIARDLGVENVGLFWPTWNHTVAVWTAKDLQGEPIRIVVPTSQIYLSDEASLGTTEFDPYKQKTIYNYRRQDVLPTFQIPKELANKMIQQVERYGAKSTKYLQHRRNQLSDILGGS